MTAVARVLPRDWDGLRLLRFLTGLALLALAFAAHLAPAQLETAGRPSPATAAESRVTESSAAGTAAAESSAAEFAAAESTAAGNTADQARPAGFPRQATSAVAVLVTIVVLVGIAGRVRPVRGPPLA